MATGFKAIQRNGVNKDSGYKTLFEKISEKTGGEKKSLSWYRSAVKHEASTYKKNFNKYITDEKRDRSGQSQEEDKNQLRLFTVEGHLYMYEYKAKMRHLPYYDRFPLVYVIKSNRSEFWGANLHYLSPKRRVTVIKKLMTGIIDIPKACFHKYINDHVDGLYIDLASAEWDTSILLPTEDFVKNINGMPFPIEKRIVWEDTNDSFYDKIKARRVISGYGTKQSREMSK